MKKFFITIFLAAALIGVTYLVKPQQTDLRSQEERQTSQEEVLPQVTETSVKYEGQEGQTAFELLRAVTMVEFKQYDFGVFVESIGGVKPDEKHFWKLYVNGTESQVGSDQLQTKNGDIIEWKLDEIK